MKVALPRPPEVTSPTMWTRRSRLWRNGWQRSWVEVLGVEVKVATWTSDQSPQLV